MYCLMRALHVTVPPILGIGETTAFMSRAAADNALPGFRLNVIALYLLT